MSAFQNRRFFIQCDAMTKLRFRTSLLAIPGNPMVTSHRTNIHSRSRRLYVSTLFRQLCSGTNHAIISDRGYTSRRGPKGSRCDLRVRAGPSKDDIERHRSDHACDGCRKSDVPTHMHCSRCSSSRQARGSGRGLRTGVSAKSWIFPSPRITSAPRMAFLLSFRMQLAGSKGSQEIRDIVHEREW